MPEEEEDVSRVTEDDSMKPMEPDGEAVDMAPYEKEQESTEPTCSVFVSSPPKLARPSRRNEMTDPQMSQVPSAQPEGTDPSTSRKRKGTEI
jgi:hypothetical protein